LHGRAGDHDARGVPEGKFLRYRTTARVRSGTVERRGTTATRNRSPRAVAAVIGPIAATGTARMSRASVGPRNRRANEVTVEDDVKVIRSSRPRRSAARTS